MSIIDKISYYQRNLENCDNEDRILHYISKLYKLPVTVQHLQQTGVGRTVNSFRKYNGTVGDAAKSLVCKWKTMVVDDTDDSSDREDEDETCVIDAHENHTDIPESPKPEDIEEDDSSSNQSSESKYMHRRKEIKSELSTKHSVVHTSKSKSEEKQEKHEKSRHSSKHHSHSERRSKESKSSKSSMTKETHSSTKHSHSKNDDSKKAKATQINEDNNKKRKTSDSSSTTKENKKRKLSDSKSDDEKPQLSISEHNRSQLKASGIQIEVKIKVEDEQFLASDNKQDVKQEKYLQGKSKSSSSKLKSQESDSKAKDSSEKQKHNKEHTSHKKYDAKSFSHHSSKETSKLKVSSSSSSNSSSSSKDYIKSKDKDKRKEHKGDKSKYEKETKIKLIQEINGEGIDCNSGASFAEALGMCSMPQPSKKRQSNSSSTNSNKPIKVERISPPINNRKILTAKSEPECSDDPKAPSLLAPNVKLEPLNVDLASTLPEISPNYKPLPYINPIQRKEEVKPVNDIIYVKNQRTKVYSGNKVGYTSVPTLYEMCIRVLIENIDALEFTGGVPYDILKPILERATADQLFMLEHHNPYLVEDTDILWQYHCNREFRNNERQEMESWREMYMRCLDEREAKLKTLTANIKQSIDKSIPVRSTKLAYVDNVVKPPRNVLKKQAKYGTANAIPATVSSVKKKLTSSGANNATNIAVPPPPMSRFKPSTSSMKKTKAPLMAKALQLIKGRYKR
ncbi:transcription elongation factor B polypeptide 3 [Solenopsis invicta]|uniref:transcription elongation factor B polypeptide 3 n=1 Tax=Solenopsis invicta TaxID=13686 RepID=UPI000595EE44|nr:transcription elongation factor B polypeptide 3 [Solenopsis invicta]